MSLSSFITFTLLIGSGRNKPTLHHSFASVVSGGVVRLRLRGTQARGVHVPSASLSAAVCNIYFCCR